MISIAIVDDDGKICDNLQQIFKIFERGKVLFIARDGEEVVRKVQEATELPQVILMDIQMRKMDGVTATQLIKSQFPSIKILMLSIFDQEDKIFQAIQAGADGYLLKDERPQKIVEAVENVLEGRMPMSPAIAAKTLSFLRNPRPKPNCKNPTDFQLTKREIEILELLSSGKSYQKIGEELFISYKTVSSHVENIYRKLGVHSKVEASMLAAKNRWFGGEFDS
ncbi:MAG: response regulator transcription factor [Bacteroidota bacterium]